MINDTIKSILGTVKGAGYYPTILESEGPSTEPTIIIQGHELLNFATNSYLGLSCHPKLIEAATSALNKYGAGSGASRLTAGSLSLHRELERVIAEFKRTEDAIVFSAGALANIGSLSALVSPPLLKLVERLNPVLQGSFGAGHIFMDSLNHASLIDGAALAATGVGEKAKVSIFPHGDLVALEGLLAESEEPNKLVVIDGVFSLHGHIAPLDKIVEIAKRFKANVYVDDAHGTGVLGDNGRGTCEHYGVEDGVDFEMGTLSKAIGVAGGFMAASREVCDYLRISARTYMFQTSMVPAQAAASIAAIKLIEDEKWRKDKLHENAHYIRSELVRLGYDIVGSTTQIVPVLVGEESKVKDAERSLLASGIFAPIYYYPAVPRGQAIIRLNIIATHTRQQLDQAIEAVMKALSH